MQIEQERGYHANRQTDTHMRADNEHLYLHTQSPQTQRNTLYLADNLQI